MRTGTVYQGSSGCVMLDPALPRPAVIFPGELSRLGIKDATRKACFV